MFDAVGLTMMFVIFSTLLLWIVIGAKGWWLLKLPVIAATLYFGIAVWYSVDSYLGWPSTQYPPRQFQLHWALVNEPAKGGNDPGGIYLWLSKMKHEDDKKIEKTWEKWFTWLGYEQDTQSPRVYIVPYSRPLHEQMQKAQEMLKKGRKIIGEFVPGEPGQVGEEGDGKGKGKGGKGKGNGKGKEGQGTGYNGDNKGLGDWNFYELPPPKFPEKMP
jgi:hypothetical protein